MQDNTGWYALYLSITQNISPAQALSVMEGRRTGSRPLTWEQFLQAYREGEAKVNEARRRRNGSEKVRNYQREYRQLHPLTEEQKAKRREYLRKYREAKRLALRRANARPKPE